MTDVQLTEQEDIAWRALASFDTDEDGQCWPGHRAIAQAMGLKDRETVGELLGSLERKNKILIKRRGKKQTNLYVLLQRPTPAGAPAGAAPTPDIQAGPSPVKLRHYSLDEDPEDGPVMFFSFDAGPRDVFAQVKHYWDHPRLFLATDEGQQKDAGTTKTILLTGQVYDGSWDGRADSWKVLAQARVFFFRIDWPALLAIVVEKCQAEFPKTPSLSVAV